jgi:hypothetical protein
LAKKLTKFLLLDWQIQLIYKNSAEIAALSNKKWQFDGRQKWLEIDDVGFQHC